MPKYTEIPVASIPSEELVFVGSRPILRAYRDEHGTLAVQVSTTSDNEATWIVSRTISHGVQFTVYSPVPPDSIFELSNIVLVRYHEKQIEKLLTPDANSDSAVDLQIAKLKAEISVREREIARLIEAH